LFVLGIPVGAFLAARRDGPVRASKASPTDAGKRFFGGFGLGVGSSLAAGCTVGHGLTEFRFWLQEASWPSSRFSPEAPSRRSGRCAVPNARLRRACLRGAARLRPVHAPRGPLARYPGRRFGSPPLDRGQAGRAGSIERVHHRGSTGGHAAPRVQVGLHLLHDGESRDWFESGHLLHREQVRAA
jgi:hypothetical protein